MTGAALDYANLTGRRPGRVVTTLGRLLPGVASVQAQADPYAAAWHAANRDALAHGGRRWVALGDSMTLGMGAPTPFDGWVGQLQRRLATAGVDLDVVNLAASGARVPDVLDQQLAAWQAMPPRADDVVTLLIGSNDLLARRYRDHLAVGFASLLPRLPDGSLVATLPQPRRAAFAANAEIERAAAERPLRVVEMRRSGPASWRGRLAADHFHPNELGYAGLADAFEPALFAATG